jgi:hypothetical protein
MTVPVRLVMTGRVTARKMRPTFLSVRSSFDLAAARIGFPLEPIACRIIQASCRCMFSRT